MRIICKSSNFWSPFNQIEVKQFFKTIVFNNKNWTKHEENVWIIINSIKVIVVCSKFKVGNSVTLLTKFSRFTWSSIDDFLWNSALQQIMLQFFLFLGFFSKQALHFSLLSRFLLNFFFVCCIFCTMLLSCYRFWFWKISWESSFPPSTFSAFSSELNILVFSSLIRNSNYSHVFSLVPLNIKPKSV